MSRSGARDYGFKLVFEYLFSQDFVIEDELEEESLEGEEKDYALSILNFLKENFNEVENKLSSFLRKPLTVKDIYTLDHAILLTSIIQIDYLKEEKGLVINEAVRLAKKYSTDKSPSFINGILSSIYNK